MSISRKAKSGRYLIKQNTNVARYIIRTEAKQNFYYDPSTRDQIIDLFRVARCLVEGLGRTGACSLLEELSDSINAGELGGIRAGAARPLKRNR